MEDRTENQIAELIERQETHERRLRLLRLQAANQGFNTPPETMLEVSSIQSEVLAIADQIIKLQISTTKAEQRQHTAENTFELFDVSLQLSSSTEKISKVQQIMFTQLIRWFDENSEIRERRQRITTLFYLAILVLLVIDIFIRFYK